MLHQGGRGKSLRPRQEDMSFEVPVGHHQDVKAAQMPPGSQESWPIHSCRPTGTGAIPISHVPVASSQAERELSFPTIIQSIAQG